MKKTTAIDRARAFIEMKNSRGKIRHPAVLDHGPLAIGHLVIDTREPGGEWTNRVDHKNLVVTQAESLMAQSFIGAANSAVNYIELGNPAPATPPTLGDIALQLSTGQRQAVTPTAVGNVATCEAIFLTTDGNGFTYTEAGLFTGPFAAGLMFARKTFTGITKTNAFEMRFRWYITFLVQTTGGDCTGIGIVGPSTVSAYTYVVAAGGEASVAATFDFAVGANHLDVYLNGQRLAPGIQYNEAAAPLTPVILGNPLNKGINLVGLVANPGDKFLLVHRTLA